MIKRYLRSEQKTLLRKRQGTKNIARYPFVAKMFRKCLTMLIYVARQNRNMDKSSQCKIKDPLMIGRNRVMSDVVLVLPSMLKNIQAMNLILKYKAISAREGTRDMSLCDSPNE
jgi:hypothetical protein